RVEGAREVYDHILGAPRADIIVDLAGPSSCLRVQFDAYELVDAVAQGPADAAGAAADVEQTTETPRRQLGDQLRASLFEVRAGRHPQREGVTTAAAPPPRRTGSAAASRRPSGRISIPVAAPISGVDVSVCPNGASAPPYWAMKAGSACVAPLRCDARGAAIASGSDMPKSRRSSRIWRTVVMIVAPPGLPTANSGCPLCSTIVGDMLERGRLPPAGRFGSDRKPVVDTGS